MSAGYDQYFFPAQKLVMQNLRQRRKRNSLVQHMLELSIPREIAFPTTTRSGRGERFAAANGCATGIPSDARKFDIGGYAALSEPVTRKPRSFSIPASDAIAVPQTPIR